MTTLSIEDLKAWLALLPRVTPGPYEVGPRIAASWPRVYICSLADGKIVAQTKQGVVATDGFEINAEHFAKCDPATIAALIEGYIAMAEALRVYGEWSIDVSTLGEFSDLEKRMNAAGITFTQLGEWASPKKPLAPALNIGGTND